MRVPLLDLVSQYKQIQDQLEPLLLQVLRSGNYIMGEQVKSFEESSARYLSAKHCISCANGSDALYVSLLALDIGPGDEVITTPFTYIASSEAIDQAGAKPVFADIDLNTFNIDPKKLKEKINSKTKAIIVVHLFGQCAAMDEILGIAKEFNIKVIEDTAQAFGAVYYGGKFDAIKAGTMGDIGTFSFYPTKNLSCAGDGGLICTNSDELAKRLRRIKAHGSERRYYHTELGVNSRLDEVQAAVLNIKLAFIDEWNAKRATNADIYYEELRDLERLACIKLPQRAAYSSHIFHQFSILVSPSAENSSELRNNLKDFLAKHEIGSEIYYPVALHMQEVYQHFNFKDKDFPEAFKASQSVLSIPVHPDLSREQVLFVCETIKDFFRNLKGDAILRNSLESHVA